KSRAPRRQGKQSKMDWKPQERKRRRRPKPSGRKQRRLPRPLEQKPKKLLKLSERKPRKRARPSRQRQGKLSKARVRKRLAPPEKPTADPQERPLRRRQTVVTSHHQIGTPHRRPAPAVADS